MDNHGDPERGNEDEEEDGEGSALQPRPRVAQEKIDEEEREGCERGGGC